MGKIIYASRTLRTEGLVIYLGVPLCGIAGYLTAGNVRQTYGVAVTALLAWFFLMLLPFRSFWKARLELSDDGVTLFEPLLKIQTPWENIETLRIGPGGIGFVLRQPLSQRAARFWVHQGHLENTLDPQLQRLAAESRFFPLRAFHKIARSEEFQRHLLEHLPHFELLTSPEKIALSRERENRERNIWTFED